MATANEKLYQSTVRHQVDLLRFSEGQAKEVLVALDAAEGELIGKIAAALTAQKDVDRLEAQLSSIQARRKQVYDAIGNAMVEDLTGLAESEYTLEEGVLHAVSPVELNLARVPLEQVHAVVASPIAGIPLKGWLNNIAETEAVGLQRAVTQGVLQGETIDQIISRIRGTKAGDYKDGVLATSRRNAEALARTSVNHVSNAARAKVWEANSDIVRARRWTSTLDGRTSSICQSRDGMVAPLPGRDPEPGDRVLSPAGVVPPAHFNCRSVMVAVLDGVELAGDRPSVMDKRTRAEREAAFRAEAKQRGVPIKQVRQEWADKHVGRVPAATSYADWLRKQPKEFQDEVLGPERAVLFRGGMPLDKFVDASGKKISLAELKAESKRHVMEVMQPGVGQMAKSLLQQGLSDEAVLTSIKAQFPDASTGINSIKSYKSELKKAGLLKYAGYKGASQVSSVDGALKGFEAKLPSGLKSAIGGQWVNVVEDLEGLPGAYAHYKAGKGVVLSAKKLAALPPEHAEMVMAHELAHLLHKQHDLLAGDPFFANLPALAKEVLSPADQKTYAYYLSHKGELVAEVVAQALKGKSTLTSQGLPAQGFLDAFEGHIDLAAKALADKFPELQAKPPLVGGPVLVGEVAGVHKTVGTLAKALLQQGLPEEQVLAGVKAQFPGAKTGLNSIKTYKSELKKQGLLGGSTGPTVKIVGDLPPPPTPPLVAALPEAKASLVEVAASVWKATAVQLFEKGVLDNYVVAAELKKLYPFNAKVNYANVASTKTAWKKLVGQGKAKSAEQAASAIAAAVKTSASGSHSTVAQAVEAAATAKAPPSLFGKSLGPYSQKLKGPLVEHAKKGGSFEEAIPIFKEVYGPNFDPNKGLELWEFCKWEAQGQPGLKEFQAAAEAVAKAKALAEQQKFAEAQAAKWAALQPSRVATRPSEGLPPPPRFTEEQRMMGIRRFGSESDTRGIAEANAKQKALGLPELTKSEYAAIRIYTSNAAFKMNRLLRDAAYSTDLELQAFVDAAQQGLMKMPKHTQPTRRGLTLHGADLEKLLSTYTVGAVIEDDAFVSTALPGGGFRGNIEMLVSGTKGVDVAQYSHYKNEKEVLFMPGTRFRVDRVERTGNGAKIHMTEV